MDSLCQLLIDLRTAGVALRFEGRRIAWIGPKGAMTASLRAALIAHKDALVVYLRFGALTVINPTITPQRTRLRNELDSRLWLSWGQVDELWALFHWHADTPADEDRALSIVMQSLRLKDGAQPRKGAA
jgi:hypothetical protein